jgi:hypothetical protein
MPLALQYPTMEPMAALPLTPGRKAVVENKLARDISPQRGGV